MIISRKILLVEDELPLGNIIRDCLESRGFAVTFVTDGRVAHETYFLERFDLIVLDVGLPSENGLNIAKGIRVADKLTPIIFLTALSMPEDVLNGFKAGGNDYLKKPFDLEELIIRIEVLLNQNRLFEHEGLKTNSDHVLIGQFTFDTKKNLLSHPEVVRKLTAREAEILFILYQNRNQLLVRSNLLVQVWGDDDFFSSRSLDVYISKMRKYFKKDNNVQIINNRGFGYKFVF